MDRWNWCHNYDKLVHIFFQDRRDLYIVYNNYLAGILVWIVKTDASNYEWFPLSRLLIYV